MRTKRTSTPIRIDNRILEELRQVVAEKDFRVFSFYGNSKQIREQMESDNHPVMAEVMTKRGLLESVVCGAIDYIRDLGTRQGERSRSLTRTIGAVTSGVIGSGENI